ncbi:hypothetical protein GRS48_01375 [Halorubrum sp. JWXQ-INN 858]|uniref:hypothetical protein n=1 Tax=Halorubrum sp. JWXQ-INN 858 TaxID=2690782 RepID=UPI001358E76B|nr:hypothetical protein [Halorubrum sp. JWXQ-INN 858]MWV63480.1 hypothetical protein [Halorubrum sp. JWXQ-INN 858]
MRIRDALESDAEALASLTGRPVDVLRDTVHDRSVRVSVSDPGSGIGTGPEGQAAEPEGGDLDGDRDGDGDRGGDGNGDRDGDRGGDGDRNADGDDVVNGFVAFDVRDGTVHVTDFAGDEPVVRRLFEEPRRFAVREGMDVEVLVTDNDAEDTAVEAAGFEPVGPGPRFEGRSTTRFRLEPDRGSEE